MVDTKLLLAAAEMSVDTDATIECDSWNTPKKEIVK